MQDKKRDGFVDELLDRALARYQSAEPRPGLEERVLARLRAGKRSAASFVWAWRLLATAGALAIIAGALYIARRGGESAAPQTVPRASQPAKALAPTVPAEARTSAPRTGLRAGRAVPATPARDRVAVPRPKQFPSPAPLSEQEKLLLRYVQETPKTELMALQKSPRFPEELKIEELRIPPLEFKELPHSTFEDMR